MTIINRQQPIVPTGVEAVQLYWGILLFPLFLLLLRRRFRKALRRIKEGMIYPPQLPGTQENQRGFLQ